MLRHFVLLLRLLPFVCACSLAASTSAQPIWPDALSDLAPDPALRQGALPNGLRYAVLRNTEPRDRVSLRFVVRAGSLHERDDERGLVHFVEHMAFRGTRRHPNGSMNAVLQKLGLAFGPDNTAFTLFDYTIYHLELPDTRDATLRLGLEVFREYAEDITFDPALIERERGVVLSELHTRDTPQERAGQASLAFLWPDARQVRRSPIGTEERIRGVTREQFVAFYDAWYRPERMAVIVVGDLPPEQVERAVADVLGPLQPRGPARTDEVVAEPAAASRPDVRIFADAGLIGANCTLIHPFVEPRTPDTHARRIQQLHRALAFAMFDRRLKRIAAASDGGFVSPFATLQYPLPGWAAANLGVSGAIADWKQFIEQIEQEHRRAFLHGFTTPELEAVRNLFVTAYEEAVRTRATQPSGWLAGELANALVAGRVFTTPAAVQADLAAALADATPADCLAAFRAAWTTASPHVFIATHPQFAVNETTLAQALNESRSVPLAAPAAAARAEFAYTDFGPPAAPSDVVALPDLDVHQARFPNGVRLNFKPTDFEADVAHVYVRVGHGRLSQPRHQPGLDLLANQLVPQGGVGRHTYQELQDICSGRAVGLSFEVDDDAFAFNARCAPRDLLFCLQLITAHLTDPAYRPEAMREVRAAFGSFYNALSSAAGGPISALAEQLLSDGDLRFGVPPADYTFARTIDEVAAWVGPQFDSGPIELSIVGATSWAEASAAVGQTLAALRPRAPPGRAAASEPVRAARPRRKAYVYTTEPHVKQVALAWLCPVPDAIDIPLERRCRLLAALLEERIRVQLREELGATYNCSADFVQREGFPALSYFMVFAEVSSAHARRAAAVLRQELDALRKGRIAEDEFQRVRTPFLRARQDDLRSNAYWGHTVLRDAQQHPRRLVAARDRAADTAAITRADLARLARRYLQPKKSFEFVAYPASHDRRLPAFPGR